MHWEATKRPLVVWLCWVSGQHSYAVVMGIAVVFPQGKPRQPDKTTTFLLNVLVGHKYVATWHLDMK